MVGGWTSPKPLCSRIDELDSDMKVLGEDIAARDDRIDKLNQVFFPAHYYLLVLLRVSISVRIYFIFYRFPRTSRTFVQVSSTQLKTIDNLATKGEEKAVKIEIITRLLISRSSIPNSNSVPKSCRFRMTIIIQDLALICSR